MWGIIPAAGKGSRIQPLAFSKELLPLGHNHPDGGHRPRAVSDFLVERFLIAGVRRICFVISPNKSDIFSYYARSTSDARICYTVQPEAAGLCDAIFQTISLIDPSQPVFIGLPDTIWFPEDALKDLPDDRFSFLLFPVDEPRLFDAVECAEDGRVHRLQVKDPNASTRWIWGAFKMPGAIFVELHRLWLERNRMDEYIGTLVNAWLEQGGEAWGVHKGATYYDVGSMDGYLRAVKGLGESQAGAAAQSQGAQL